MTEQNVKLNYEIEKAIKFLIEKLNSTRNKKPVIIHSIRVGLNLSDNGYCSDVVLAGFLHDLLEDSDTTYLEINKQFNKRIADLVEANTFDINDSDRLNRSIKTFHKCAKLGKEALVIKASDIFDNMNYFCLVKDNKTKQYLIKKWSYFIRLAKELIGQEIVYKDLNNKFLKIQNEI